MYFSIVCYITIHGIMRKKNRENMCVWGGEWVGEWVGGCMNTCVGGCGH